MRMKFNDDFSKVELKRIFGINVIVVLAVFGALGSFLGIAYLDSWNSLFFGFSVSTGNAKMISVFHGLISLICAIGLFKLKKSAWTAYIIFNIYGLIHAIANTISIHNTVNNLPLWYRRGSHIAIADRLTMVNLGLVLTFISSIIIITYLASKRRYFK